jgi:hypothetical protein
MSALPITETAPPTTKEILAGMLKENTGRSFLDSGDHYGRHWQRNQTREFDAEKYATLSFRYGEISVTVNLYHWLAERLDYSPEWQARFDRFVERETKRDPDASYRTWFKERDLFLERLEKVGWTIKSYGGGDEPFHINTYNEENFLSQDIEFVWFEAEHPLYGDESVVCLMIHNGCDARGGYTEPKWFTLSGYGETSILDYNQGVAITCEGTVRDDPQQMSLCEGLGLKRQLEPVVHQWYLDGGNYWTNDSYPERIENLETFPTYDMDDDLDDDNPTPKVGYLSHAGDEGYCPICCARLVI